MRRLLAILALAGVAAIAQATPPQHYFDLHRVAAGVYAAIDAPHSPAGSNAGFIVGSDGVAVVDTFENVDAARALLAAIRARTKLPIRFVINTHYHLDHVTGNQVFSDVGAEIIAQRNVHAWIHTDNLKFFGPHPTAAQRARVAAFRAPDLGYDGNVTLWLGRREVDIRVLPGHTGGDSAVLVPNANVVFTGDLFWRQLAPNLIDASTEPLLDTLGRLERWPPHPQTAVFVPGHGALGGRADVAAFRGYVAALRAHVAQARRRGLSEQALVQAVVGELKKEYGAWNDFAHFAPLNAAQTAAEMAGTKPLPHP